MGEVVRLVGYVGDPGRSDHCGAGHVYSNLFLDLPRAVLLDLVDSDLSVADMNFDDRFVASDPDRDSLVFCCVVRDYSVP